jgi:hypothetical protein
LENLNVLKEYKKSLDFLCGLTIIGLFMHICNKNYVKKCDIIYVIVQIQYMWIACSEKQQ